MSFSHKLVVKYHLREKLFSWKKIKNSLHKNNKKKYIIFLKFVSLKLTKVKYKS